MIAQIKTGLLLYIFLCTGGLMAARVTVSDSAAGIKLSAAVSRAQAGDTIVVDGGHYHVNRLEIKKPLTLLGNNDPVLDGNNLSGIIDIFSDSVIISGFVL